MDKDKKKKYEPPVPTRVGKKKKKTKGPDAASKLPLGELSACPGSPVPEMWRYVQPGTQVIKLQGQM